jgi:hypothetical protein
MKFKVKPKTLLNQKEPTGKMTTNFLPFTKYSTLLL